MGDALHEFSARSATTTFSFPFYFVRKFIVKSNEVKDFNEAIIKGR